MTSRFSRLLGACELLSRDETAALCGRDFATLGRTQGVKAALLADLAAEAQLCHASGDSSARDRLLRLVERNRQNSRLLGEMTADTADKLEKVRIAARQLHAMRSSYQTGTGADQASFNAHG